MSAGVGLKIFEFSSLLYQFSFEKSQLAFLYFSRHQEQHFLTLVLCDSNGDPEVLSYDTDGRIFIIKNRYSSF